MKKNIEWLKEQIEVMETETSENYPHEQMVEREVVLRLIDQLDEPEALSVEWIDEHKESRINNLRKRTTSDVVPADKLQNLLVPKQELPVIPKYVADWIECIKPNTSLRAAFEYIAKREADNYDDPLAFWVGEGNSETFARAWLDGYTVEKEPLYYALIIGHELLKGKGDWIVPTYWCLDTTNGNMFISDRITVRDKFLIEASKSGWNKLGINDSNASFVKVEELEE